VEGTKRPDIRSILTGKKCIKKNEKTCPPQVKGELRTENETSSEEVIRVCVDKQLRVLYNVRLMRADMNLRKGQKALGSGVKKKWVNGGGVGSKSWGPPLFSTQTVRGDQTIGVGCGGKKGVAGVGGVEDRRTLPMVLYSCPWKRGNTTSKDLKCFMPPRDTRDTEAKCRNGLNNTL